MSLNLARVAIPTFVISCRPIAFSQNPITYYNNFATRSKLFPTVTERLQHFLLDPAKQSTPRSSLTPVLAKLHSYSSLSQSPFLPLPSQGNPYHLKVILRYAPAAMINRKDRHRGNVNSQKILGLCGFLFFGKSIKQQMTLRIHCNKPSTQNCL